MQIGRKIYFELANGNVILDTGEREGDVIETTLEQDFESFVALTQRVRETVGVLNIPFGQDRDKFGQYAYHIDPATESIVWDLTPIQQEEAAKQQTLEEKVKILDKQVAQTSTDLQGFMDFYFTNTP